LNSIILHHYPPSLFSEKVRALLGYLQLDWQSVIIPPIMPRPHLMPLSGGYRKTPIMQIGANIYCDTEIICRKLNSLSDKPDLYAAGFNAERVARWADTELFRTTVALNFRPEAIAAQMSQMSSADLEAFQKDRAELSGGSAIVAVDPTSAETHFKSLMDQLARSLTTPFLFGDLPSIADFSVYHCLWFVAGNAANAHLMDPWPPVIDFMARMRELGHGQFEETSAETALEIGCQSRPSLSDEPRVDPTFAGKLTPGIVVGVSPNDYGRTPVVGVLHTWTENEIIILRDDALASEIAVHFPNIGFEVQTVDL